MRTLPLLVPLVLALGATGCGELELPPPNAPAQALPESVEVPTDPPPPGKGRVVLEANGERARVVEVAGGMVHSRGQTFGILAQRPVCAATPCAVDVERGAHHFVFLSADDPNRGGVAEVDVGAKPKVVRHAMGERIEHPALTAVANTGITIGLLGAITGGALMVGGALSNAADESLGNDGNSKIVPAGGAILGIGAGVLALGITFAILGRPELRRGSTTELPLEGPSQPSAPKPTTTTVKLVPTASGLGLAF